MASRQADSEALVDRCRKINWKVERNSKGYKVWPPAPNAPLVVHLTYSDIMSLKNVEQRLERYGLSDTEKAIKETRQTESRGRNEIAREVAERRGKELAAKGLVTRAAGPYLTEPEEIDLDWLISPHPSPWMRWVYIDSDQARKILADHNADNRPLSPTTHDYYRDIMLAGLWHLTHQGIAFDARGMLQDGQHRFTAQVKAAEAMGEVLRLPYAVFVGMPIENFKSIDEGRVRVARQLFAKDGEKNTSALQSVVRLVHYYHDGDARKAARLRLPNQVVIDAFEKDGEAFRDSVNWGARNHTKIRGMSNPALGAAYYLIRKRNGDDNEYVRQFFAGLVSDCIPGTRVMLDDDDPRHSLRRKLSDIRDAIDKGRKGERRSALTQVGMVVATWNNMVIGKRLRNLYFNDDTTIPEILRCIPGEGGVPALFLSPKAALAA